MQVNGDCEVNRVCNVHWHFWLLLRNHKLDSLQTWWGCVLGGSLLCLYKWSWSSDFWIFYDFFGSFFGQILKNLYPCIYSTNCFEIAYGHFWVWGSDMYSRWVTLTSFPRSRGKVHEIHCLCGNLRTIRARTFILHMLVVLNEGQTKTVDEWPWPHFQGHRAIYTNFTVHLTTWELFELGPWCWTW